MPAFAATIVLGAREIAQSIGLAVTFLHIGAVDGRTAEDKMPRILHDTAADIVFERRVDHPLTVSLVIFDRALAHLLTRYGELCAAGHADGFGDGFTWEERLEGLSIHDLCLARVVAGWSAVFLLWPDFRWAS